LRRDDADIFGGMIAGTVCGVLFVPVLFVSLLRLVARAGLHAAGLHVHPHTPHRDPLA
jgi:hypothetical protein